MIFKIFEKSAEVIFSDIFTGEDTCMENILRGTWMNGHMDSMSGVFSNKTLLPI